MKRAVFNHTSWREDEDKSEKILVFVWVWGSYVRHRAVYVHWRRRPWITCFRWPMRARSPADGSGSDEEVLVLFHGAGAGTRAALALQAAQLGVDLHAAADALEERGHV